MDRGTNKLFSHERKWLANEIKIWHIIHQWWANEAVPSCNLSSTPTLSSAPLSNCNLLTHHLFPFFSLCSSSHFWQFHNTNQKNLIMLNELTRVNLVYNCTKFCSSRLLFGFEEMDKSWCEVFQCIKNSLSRLEMVILLNSAFSGKKKVQADALWPVLQVVLSEQFPSVAEEMSDPSLHSPRCHLGFFSSPLQLVPFFLPPTCLQFSHQETWASSLPQIFLVF